MKIEIKSTDAIVEEKRSITSNFVADYTFINMTVCVEIEINNKIRYFVLQNGLSYHANNYDLPRNKLQPSVDGGCDPILAALYDVDFEDKNDIEYFFENHDEFNQEFNEFEAIEIYQFLHTIETSPSSY